MLFTLFILQRKPLAEFALSYICELRIENFCDTVLSLYTSKQIYIYFFILRF